MGKKSKEGTIPRRVPSVVPPVRVPIYPSADKSTCAECICYPKEEPYQKKKKLKACQVSPLTLYEIAALIVDTLRFPVAFTWTEDEVANWAGQIGFQHYEDCFLDNNINGLRLLMFEDPSNLPSINIHDFQDILKITSTIRNLYGTDFIRFTRSIGLPPRKPLTHCTWFKSRTGPSWGIRQNWTRSDVLRWMKILMPEPLRMDHWDLVWYQKPDFPKVMFARGKKFKSEVIPHYVPIKEVRREYTIPRKFRFQTGIKEEDQLIWMEEQLDTTQDSEEKKIGEEKADLKSKKKDREMKGSRLIPKYSLTGKHGREFLLAKRKMPKPKFFS